MYVRIGNNNNYGNKNIVDVNECRNPIMLLRDGGWVEIVFLSTYHMVIVYIMEAASAWFTL